MSLSKPLPTLTQMPWNVKQDIVHSMDTVTKFSVRQCSKEFKCMVDSSRIHYKSLCLHSDHDYNTMGVHLCLDDECNESRGIEFFSHPNGYSKQTYYGDITHEEIDVIGTRSNIDAAVARFCRIIGNPKASFYALRISCHYPKNPENEEFQTEKSEVLNKIEAFLGSLNHKISAREFKMEYFDCQEDILKVLPYLEAGILKNLDFDLNFDDDRNSSDDNMDLSKVYELEQWKQADELRHMDLNLNLPLEKWVHFSICSFEMKGFSLKTAKDLIEAFFKYPNKLYFHIYCYRNNKTEFLEYLSQFETVRPQRKFKVPIANTTEHIAVEVSTASFTFYRRSEADGDSVSDSDNESDAE